MTENITPEQAQKLLQALDEEADQVLASLVRLALFNVRAVKLLPTPARK